MMEEWECEYELGSAGWKTTRRKKTELYEKEEPNENEEETRPACAGFKTAVKVNFRNNI